MLIAAEERAEAIKRMIRNGASNLLDAITAEIHDLDIGPLSKHAAARLENYANQLATTAREIQKMQS
jgi:hypothetical protein